MIAFWIHHKGNSLYYKSAAAGKTASGVKGKSFFFFRAPRQLRQEATFPTAMKGSMSESGGSAVHGELLKSGSEDIAWTFSWRAQTIQTGSGIVLAKGK